MGNDSTRKPSPRKSAKRPEKPFEGFELYAHPLGYWSKKIGGQILHFGRWGRVVKGKLKPTPYEAGWKEALATYKARHGDAEKRVIVGTVVDAKKSAEPAELTIGALCNRFLTAKTHRVESGELSPRSFQEYKEATDMLVDKFGKNRRVTDFRPSDFESIRADMAKRWGPARLGKFVQLIRSVFRYAEKNFLVDRAVQCGTEFVKPTKPTMRKHKAAGGKKLFTAAELRTILDALAGKEVTTNPDKKTGKTSKYNAPANAQLRAAALLAINAGLGNSDIGGMQHSHLDLNGGWLDYNRGKTGLPRRAPLWPETVTAIRASIKVRPAPKSKADADCVFLNRLGRRLVQSTTTAHSDYVSKQFRKLLKELRINGRMGLGFYSIRHTHATIGLQTGDRDACRALMGHVENDTISHYDESGPSNERLQAVVDHIRGWLFGEGGVQ